MNIVVLSTLVLVLAIPLAMAAHGADKTVVSLGTATPGGGFPVYGEAVAGVINEGDASLEVRPQNTKGSAENIPLLEDGKLDLGLVQGEAAMLSAQVSGADKRTMGMNVPGNDDRQYVLNVMHWLSGVLREK